MAIILVIFTGAEIQPTNDHLNRFAGYNRVWLSCVLLMPKVFLWQMARERDASEKENLPNEHHRNAIGFHFQCTAQYDLQPISMLRVNGLNGVNRKLFVRDNTQDNTLDQGEIRFHFIKMFEKKFWRKWTTIVHWIMSGRGQWPLFGIFLFFSIYTNFVCASQIHTNAAETRPCTSGRWSVGDQRLEVRWFQWCSALNTVNSSDKEHLFYSEHF